jgi:hypothetical protein
MLPNTGWVLTPNPGATIAAAAVQVAVDGVFLNQVFTMSAREDITAGFPQFDTTQAGRGAFIDTTAFADGVHTIGWFVTDSTGKADGVGSRFFRVANGSSSIAAVRVDAAPAMVARGGVRARRGWDRSAPLEDLAPVDGVFSIESRELERVELDFHSDLDVVYDGYATVLGERRPLPAGSRLDRHTGVFTWQPGPGFLGAYDLVFTAIAGGRAVSEWPVRIVLAPASKPPAPEIVIDTPSAGAIASGSFVIAGWAVDRGAAQGPGVSLVHVWAYPATGGLPIFLGAAECGGARADVAALYGNRFAASGFGLIVAAPPPGDYTIAAFPWSTATQRFGAAATVPISVR